MLIDVWGLMKSYVSAKDKSVVAGKFVDIAMDNGAIGGKLVGAGGGGFLMFMANDRNKLRKALNDAGMEEVRFNFDFNGTRTIIT